MEAGICIANPLAARKRSGSIGVPIPDVEVRLFDASTGQECGVDEVGEMWIRGPQVSQSYWSNPLATAHAMKDGWFHTGDLAKRDEDGFFYLMEREEDVIHPRLQDDGGQTGEELKDIYPSEIEEVLYELQEVAEVAVTSWREDNGALEIVAFIVPRHTAIGTLEPLDIAHLHDWCRSRLRPFSGRSRSGSKRSSLSQP